MRWPGEGRRSLGRRPTLVNLSATSTTPPSAWQTPSTWSTTSAAWSKLRGRGSPWTWAYSPYGKPLRRPMGVVGLMTPSHADVVLAHPEGYRIMPEVEGWPGSGKRSRERR